MNGTIFNIQKFSIHDGPGIRTTVFFKGCNLKCEWCANPESQCIGPQLTLDREKCIGCMKCVDGCPSKARTKGEGLPVVYPDKCVLCTACLNVCPAQAIGMEGRSASVEEILKEVMKDKPFYDHSGGGVTLSGGEVLLQQEFALKLVRALHENGIHVAAETAACVSNERFREFLKEMDFIFVDLKHYDSVRHREGTGVGNELITENIRTVVESGVEYCIRIPVIPGYNDAAEDAMGFAKLLNELGVNRAQLLPFHQFGERKYALLDRDYAYAGKGQLHKDDLRAYIELFKAQGIDVWA